MQLPTILLARVLAYIDFFTLAPGEISLPSLSKALVERFEFERSPRPSDKYDLKEGIEFYDGHAGRIPIQKFVIYDGLLVIETRVGTEACEEILLSMLSWGVERLGLNYAPGDIKHFAYVSDLTFYSPARLLIFDPLLDWLAKQSTGLLSSIWKEPIECEPVSLKVGHAPAARKYSIAPFSIERRGDTHFSDHKYFSEAPLPTRVHMDMLRDFEEVVSSRQRSDAD